ncbi:DUF3037 domain-containing protein [Sphingobacterium bovistauri]|uniref:DUF3037 domain-containing protein n=1 Tax=Sphingobacterium bovistauri TaxID=2781959 RepID=A0ABS7Z914_9SPHI|nr:DUF3037 domain-containing protein [Sphingobacterium bovistauri]MCA5006062.1 DUF3037 domain-containing protein [Sphingobacterium bovistauri]
MSVRTLYEYAVVRVVPRAEREEFVNVGVALYCKKFRYAEFLFHLNAHKIKALYSESDIEEIKRHLESFQKICAGDKSYGRIANLDQAERFRWLTANRSTIIQCSPSHTGMCISAEDTHKELVTKLVL